MGECLGFCRRISFSSPEGPRDTPRTIVILLDAGMSRLAFADELNANGMPTARGGAWSRASIGNILKRI